MQNFLRPIAVMVDEPDPGAFYWMLIEFKGDNANFDVLSSSPGAHRSYDLALAAGVVELRRLCEDSALGPRRAQEGTEENPSGWSPLL